jgi:hypothetical protein
MIYALDSKQVFEPGSGPSGNLENIFAEGAAPALPNSPKTTLYGEFNVLPTPFSPDSVISSACSANHELSSTTSKYSSHTVSTSPTQITGPKKLRKANKTANQSKKPSLNRTASQPGKRKTKVHGYDVNNMPRKQVPLAAIDVCIYADQILSLPRNVTRG